jgi:hypothetical protein
MRRGSPAGPGAGPSGWGNHLGPEVVIQNTRFWREVPGGVVPEL